MVDRVTIAGGEPIEIRYNLALAEPFEREISRGEYSTLTAEIDTLRSQVDRQLLELVTRRAKEGTSELERSYRKLIKEKKFYFPSGENGKALSTGYNSLSRKLEVVPNIHLKNRSDFSETYYSLMRLLVCLSVADTLAATGFISNLADVMTIFREEGDLAIPLSMKEFGLKLLPNEALPSDFPVFQDFIGTHHTIDLGKKDPPLSDYQDLIHGLKERVTSHDDLVEQSGMNTREVNVEQGSAEQILSWLQCGKESAMTLFLGNIFGLDFYIDDLYFPGQKRKRNIPGDLSADSPKNTFVYNYVRNRFSIDESKSIPDLKCNGEELYEQITSVNIDDFVNGRICSNTLVYTIFKGPPRRIQGNRNQGRIHILPYNGYSFVFPLLTEAMIRLEFCRRVPIIFRGPEFRTPLPSPVAYIRFNAWDVYFVVLVLDVLSGILRKDQTKVPGLPEEQGDVKTLRTELNEYKKSGDVWTVLDNWTKDSGYKLMESYYRERRAIRDAIVMDANNFDGSSIPGKEENALIDDIIIGEGKLDTAFPMFETMSKKRNANENLWEIFSRVMIAHMAPGNKPWMGYSPIWMGNEVGRNVLRFSYIHQGFAKVLE